MTAEEIFREAEKHEGKYLLPRRYLNRDYPDLYDPCKELVNSGRARWLSAASTFYPGIQLTGKPWDEMG